MDAKEMKAALKMARDAIRAKEYKETLKHCKSILKNDKGNYNALVFVGVAAEGLEQPEQAIAAYRKATDVAPEQILAWQGLCSFYEKADKEDYRTDLAQVYNKLMQLCADDNNKKFDIGLKLAQLYSILGTIEKAVDMYCELRCITVDDKQKLLLIERRLVKLLEQQVAAPVHKLLLSSYETIIKMSDDRTEVEASYTCLIKLLAMDNDSEAEIGALCEKMTSQFPSVTFPIEVICQMFLDLSITESTRSKEVMDGITEKLQRLDPCSPFPSLVQGYWALRSKDYLHAKSLLSQGAASCVSELVYLAKTHLYIHQYSQAASTTNTGLAHLSKKDLVFYGDRQNVKRLLEYYKARSYTELGSPRQLTTAIDICLSLLESDQADLDTWLCLGLTYLKAGQPLQAEETLAKLGSHGESRQLHLLTGLLKMSEQNYESARTSFQAALALDPSCALSHFFLAKVLWEICRDKMEGQDTCLRTLLQAARLDPFYSPTFLYLGRFYSQVARDLTKARKCFEKAFQLNPTDSEAGTALVDMLTNLGDEQQAENILKSVTTKATAGSAKWAWLRLGLLYMKRDDPSAAIMCLQSALRADPTDNHMWECLGDAYMNRGSYNAALKAFTKATQLEPTGLYCYHQMASIKHTLGLYVEALEEYDGVLRRSEGYTPALAGLVETHLSLAQSALGKFFHGRAVDHCQKAVEQATKAVQGRPDLSCLWKLLGDACTIIYPVPDDICRMQVPQRLLTGTERTGETSLLSKSEILQLGSRCYGMALKLQPKAAALWHDLGINYYRQTCLTTGAMVSVMASKAVQALQRAVTLDADSPRHWTALGVVAASKGVNHPALAQHCYIRAVQVEPSYVEAWTNLATLYLCRQNIKLAHEAFKVAQATQPTFVNSWIGQALIAETVGDNEAMDLFRHTAEMDNHTEGAVGYASWVCSVMNDESKMNTESYRYAICQMSAITAASDALAKYTDRVRTNATAFNMYGLLVEKQKLYRLAVNAFACATKLLEENRGPEDQLRAARINYARALCGLGKAEEAVIQYQAAGKLGSVSEYCGLGLAAYKSGQLDISQEAYTAAASLAETATEQSHILASLAMVLYKSGDVEATKTALFECSQLTPPSLWGLKALCSLGLLQQDLPLAAAALQELQKLPDSSADLPYLTACKFILQGDVNAARRHLAKCTHVNPDNARLWRHLAAILLNNDPRYEASACCAAVARHLDPTSQELTAWLSLSPVTAGWHSQTSSYHSAFHTAQKVFHTHPDSLPSVSSLVSASLAQHLFNSALGNGEILGKFCQSIITKLMSTVEEQLTYMVGDKSHLQSLHLWCVKQFVIIQLSVGETEHARQFLQNAVWLYEGDAFLQCLLAFSDKNMPELKTAAAKDGTGYTLQLLALLYLSCGLQKDMENSYRSCIQQARTREENMILLVKLTHMAYEQLLDESCDKLTKTFKDLCDMALKLDSTCCAIYLMQAVLHLRNDNQRTARHCFEQVLYFRHSRHSLGFATRMASRHLLKIHLDRQDDARVQRLLADVSDDKDLLDLHCQLKKTQPTPEKIDHWDAVDI
ncbi:Tetratricopeptide repeat protein 37 [Lamellibrachia satsuma]|nr:Tetratricopeptide repeat protein 37 [Lamellibrachia satsuma]